MHRPKHLVQVFLDTQAMDHLEAVQKWYSRKQGRETSASEVIEGLIMAHWKRSVALNMEKQHRKKREMKGLAAP